MFRVVVVAVVIAVFAVGNLAYAGLSAPFHLRCESRINPQGIDALQPRLSWNSQANERAYEQSAYQILVASSLDKLRADEGDLWDSGKTASSLAIQIPYEGIALASFQPCWWKVRAWDQQDVPSPWSEPAHWSMGVLKEEEWQGARWVGLPGGEVGASVDEDLMKAQWIWGPGEQAASAAKPGKCYFRATVAVSAQGAAKAVCFLTGDNHAKAYLNGEFIGENGNFKALTEISLDQKLRPGDNILAIAVENAGDAPNPAGLMALVRWEDQDGQVHTKATDASWKAHEQLEDGWEKAECDDAAWAQAQVLGTNGMTPWGEIRPAPSRVLPARMLRREMDLRERPRRASLYASGLGLSELYINGEKVGDHVLSPGCTEYDKRVFYVSHDVTNMLQSGPNAAAAWLGNGRYYAPRVTEPTTTRTYDYPKLLLLLRLEYADGEVNYVVSDASWKATDQGPIRANNEYDGETYDARMELAGWAAPGFDDADWVNASVMEAPGGVVSAQMAEPIRVTEEIRPIALTNPMPGVYIYDMGQNMVGWCRMTVRGPRGAAVRQRHAETLKDDGALYLDNIRGAKVTNEYILKGDGVERYEPRFTYHGFRYIEISGYPGEPTLNDIVGCVVHDDAAPAGAFSCSNPLINQIAKNIRWGVRGNYRSMPTDCPQRDERQGWLGDRSMECKGETYLYDIAALYAKWVCDMEDGQQESGSVSDVCPSYWPLYNDNVTWPSSFIIIPGMLYQHYGDDAVIARHYDGMKKWITHMSGYLEDNIMPRDNYGDWCVPPEEQTLIHSKDPARKTPGDFLATAYFCYDLRLMRQYASLLGREDDARAFQQQYEAILAAFNKKFLDEEQAQYANGTETSCVLPLAFELAPESVRERLFERLVDSIMVKGQGHLSTGLIGGQWLMRTLTQHGRPDVAYTLASQTAYPSWGYMVSKNATTIWELWNGDTADPAMNSGNHVMLVGDLNIWLYEHVVGIRPDSPGFKTMILDPVILDGLEFAQASHRSPYGQIFSRWEKRDGKLIWNITIPANTTAAVHVPAEDLSAITESGAPAMESVGLKHLGAESGKQIFKAGSGQYRFEMPR